jgi:hypothetical protein
MFAKGRQRRENFDRWQVAGKIATMIVSAV